LGGGRAIWVVDGKVVEQSPTSNLAQLKPKRAPKKRLTDTEAKKEIERILGSDLKQARKIVRGGLPTNVGLAQANPPSGLDMERRILAAGVFGGAAALDISTHRQGQGVTIELGDRWKGNANDLSALSKVANLTEVKLSGQNMDDSSMKQIAAIESISKLVFDKCEINSKGIKGAQWPQSLREIELANLTVNNDLLTSIESFPAANLLTFRECELDTDVKFEVLKRSKNLRGLQFQGLDISGDLFKSFDQIYQLSYVNLSYCKFKTKDYKALKKRRPTLQVSYSAQAVLGIYGPTDMRQSAQNVNCLVSSVIPGSGADRGGIKANDIIETVDGEKVEIFEDLKLHIAQHRAGDKLNVTVKRLGKSIDLKIELSAPDNLQP